MRPFLFVGRERPQDVAGGAGNGREDASSCAPPVGPSSTGTGRLISFFEFRALVLAGPTAPVGPRSPQVLDDFHIPHP